MKDFRKQHGGGAGREGGFERREGGNDFRGPKRDFDNRGGFDRKQHSGRNETMHQAVCSECGRSCEVPFVPNGAKPVYCNDCFSAKKGAQTKSFEKRDFNAPRPSHHEDRAPNAPAPRDHRVDELKSQMDAMNSKLDRLVKMMEVNLATMTTPKHFETKTSEPSKLEKVLKTMPVVVKEEKKDVKKEVKKVVVAAKKPAAKAPAKVASKAKPVAKKKK